MKKITTNGMCQMDLKYNGDKISFLKELNQLDELTLDFSELLSKFGIGHAYVSGYVAILFGRNRSSEDIYIICETIDFDLFTKLWDNINNKFECIITSDVHNAYNEYLMKKTAIRFSYKNQIIPNVELKFESNDMHKEALRNSIEVLINKRKLPIAPLEQQIAYKIYMNSEKDIEDARFLFKLFEDNLDKQKIISYLDGLEVSIPQAKQYLGWSD